VYDGAGAAGEFYLHGPLGGAPIAAGLTWLIADHQGSVRALAVGGDVGTSFVTYGAFGQTVSGTPGRFGYAGYEADPGAKGLLRAGARHYEPAVGRFISKDPGALQGFLGGER
jgi:RHS repeat-associated protein